MVRRLKATTNKALAWFTRLDYRARMGARTGDEYISGLKDDRTVWLDGRRVDVVSEPRFAGFAERS